MAIPHTLLLILVVLAVISAIAVFVVDDGDKAYISNTLQELVDSEEANIEHALSQEKFNSTESKKVDSPAMNIDSLELPSVTQAPLYITTETPNPSSLVTPTSLTNVSATPTLTPTLTPSPSQTPKSSYVSISVSPTPMPTVIPTPTPVDTSICTIKGNISGSNKIYHIPGCTSYSRTKINESQGEQWFCTEQSALNAGWRKASNCPAVSSISPTIVPTLSPSPTATPTSTQAQFTVPACASTDCDCPDFESRAHAQWFFDNYDPTNEHRLDGNNKNGLACESLQ